jgi:DNA-binding NarL/FixJ family response regulator
MIRLLIADDHPVVREGLRYVVSQNRDVQVVGEAEDGDAALDLCRRVPADVLLLDVAMPGPGVLELLGLIKSACPRLHILVLSVHAERLYARRVLKAGADGYITKNHTPQSLAAAIRHVHEGKKYVTPAVAEELISGLRQGSRSEAHEALSSREYAVFLQLGAGKSVEEIARELRLSPKTVRTYRSRIMEKANFSSTAELIFYAVRTGLVGEIVQPRERNNNAVKPQAEDSSGIDTKRDSTRSRPAKRK